VADAGKAEAEQQKATMVHALREEPGTYSRDLGGGREVLYWVRASGEGPEGGFVAGWEYRATGAEAGAEAERSHEERFSSHADAVTFLQKSFDDPISGRGI
jgi:hypothetical protein